MAPDGGPKSYVQIQQVVLPTMQVKLADGSDVVINTTDFDPELHTEVGPKRAKKPVVVEEEEVEEEEESPEAKKSKKPKIR